MVIDNLEFHFRHPVSVRFRDVDVGGHAHHSEALIYMEEARAAYWEHVTGLAGLGAINYVLAEVTVRYHQRVLWPETLDVGVRTVRLGRKHFEMAYAVDSPVRGRLVSGRTVQVMYDYEAGGSVRMPDSLRARIEALDGPFPGAGTAGEARS